jgi:hypothetical protein
MGFGDSVCAARLAVAKGRDGVDETGGSAAALVAAIASVVKGAVCEEPAAFEPLDDQAK